MAPGQAGHLAQQAVAARADRGVEGVAADGEAEGLGPGGQVEQLGGGQLLEGGQRLLDGQVGLGDGQVVADDELAVVAEAAGELLELEREQPAVDAELDDVAGDLVADPAHHLEALEHAGDVAHGDEVLDLERRQRAGDLVEAGLVALEGLQRLVGAGQDGAGVLEDVAPAVDVEGDDAHGLADRDHGVAGLLGDPLGGAVPGAGLAGLDRGVGQQLGGGAQDPRGLAVEHDGAVHLGQLAQPGGGELDVEREAAGGQLLDGPVVAEHDQRTGAAAQDALQTVAQLGARGHGGEGGAQRVVLAKIHSSNPFGAAGLGLARV